MEDFTTQYNVKTKIYSNGETQIRTYSRPIKYNISKEIRSERKVYCSIAEARYYAKKSLQSSNTRAKSKIYDLARENADKFAFFITLTFNPEKVNSFNYDEVTKKLSQWIRNFRKKVPSLLYLAVPERHKSGRYHFHFLMSADVFPLLKDSGIRTKTGQVIYNLPVYRYGFSTATIIENQARCCSYITKYISKELLENTPNKKRYWHSKNLMLPRVQKNYIEPVLFEEYTDSLKERANYYKIISYSTQSLENEEIGIYEFNKRESKA